MEKEDKTLKHRVITMLTRQEMDFLDKMGKDALFSTGHKLSYNDFLKGLVDLAMQMGLSGEKIDSAKTLEEKMFELMRQDLERKLKNTEHKTEEQNKGEEDEN